MESHYKECDSPSTQSLGEEVEVQVLALACEAASSIHPDNVSEKTQYAKQNLMVSPNFHHMPQL